MLFRAIFGVFQSQLRSKRSPRSIDNARNRVRKAGGTRFNLGRYQRTIALRSVLRASHGQSRAKGSKCQEPLGSGETRAALVRGTHSMSVHPYVWCCKGAFCTPKSLHHVVESRLMSNVYHQDGYPTDCPVPRRRRGRRTGLSLKTTGPSSPPDPFTRPRLKGSFYGKADSV